MFQKVRMPSRQLQWIFIIIMIGVIAIVISYEVELSNSCSMRQLVIVGDAKKYDESKPFFSAGYNSRKQLFTNSSANTTIAGGDV